MNWQTNRLVMAIRSLARRAGTRRAIGILLTHGSYEERFDQAMLESVEAADIVWDVGANIGRYTLKLCERVGPTGTIFAFGTSPQNRATLERVLTSIGNAVVVPIALGKTVKSNYLARGREDIQATSRLVERAETDAEMGQMMTGEHAVAEGVARAPAVIKIDTEMHELDIPPLGPDSGLNASRGPLWPLNQS